MLPPMKIDAKNVSKNYTFSSKTTSDESYAKIMFLMTAC